MKSKSFDEADAKLELETEYWYKTKHNVQKFSDALLKKMKEPACDVSKLKLDLPPENKLIPENLDVLAEDKENGTTKILKQWPDCDLWYQKDNKFERPKAYVNMKIYTKDDEYGTSPEKKSVCHLVGKSSERASS